MKRSVRGPVRKVSVTRPATLFKRVQAILEQGRDTAARSVNSAQVVANWLIGREIVEDEQRGEHRAGYGERLLRDLSTRLSKAYGAGFSVNNLEHFRRFYLLYPELLDATQKSHAVRGELPQGVLKGARDAGRGKSHALRGILEKPYGTWAAGRLSPALSWTHYRTLLRVEHAQARSFYEVETVSNAWSARELERQINSLLFERLARSKDKKGVMRLARKGHEITSAVDVFKDPVVIEFLGLPRNTRIQESDLESLLIGNLQDFLLELGKGFALVSRQERITLDGDHFYIDLVFYHTVLKCYILIDLKVGKLTHGDLGQIQLYVNYFDEERRTKGDNPTLGLILCTDKNDAVVRYTIGKDNRKIFASRYKLHVPSEAELTREIRRELEQFRG